MLPPCLEAAGGTAPGETRGNPFQNRYREMRLGNNCHRGLEMFCLSGPARQRFDLTYKSSSSTFHEVPVDFYGLLVFSFGLHIVLFWPALALSSEFFNKC